MGLPTVGLASSIVAARLRAVLRKHPAGSTHYRCQVDAVSKHIAFDALNSLSPAEHAACPLPSHGPLILD